MIMNEEVYTKVIPAGEKTYFIDVKRTSAGNAYVKIAEERVDEGKKIRNSITIFRGYVGDMIDALREASKYM